MQGGVVGGVAGGGEEGGGDVFVLGGDDEVAGGVVEGGEGRGVGAFEGWASEVGVHEFAVFEALRVVEAQDGCCVVDGVGNGDDGGAGGGEAGDGGGDGVVDGVGFERRSPVEEAF